MNKTSQSKILIILYIFLAFVLIYGWIVQFVPSIFVLYYLPIGVLNKASFNLIIAIISFAIFLKANKEYSLNKNKKMVIIAGSFLCYSIIEMISFISFCRINIGGNYLFDSQNFSYLFGDFIPALALFATIIYMPKTINTLDNKFRKNIYMFFIGINIFLILFDLLLVPLLFDLFREYIYKIELNFYLSKIAEEAFYLLTAFIYADLRISDNKKIYSNFNIGLFILGFLPIMFILGYSTTLYPLFNYLAQIIGFSFIFFGLKDINNYKLNIRQKLAAFLSLFLIISYMVFIPIGATIAGVNFPFYSTFLFLIYFLLTTIVQYLLSFRFTKPIDTVIQHIEKIKTDEKPLEIPVISSDEIGLLTEKINESNELIWEQARREKVLRDIIETSKITLDTEELLKIICTKLANLFNVERVMVIEYSNLNNIENFDIKGEYLDDINKKEIIENFKYLTIYKKIGEFYSTRLIKENKLLIIEDIANSDIPDYIKDFYKTINAKSLIASPILKENNESWGFLLIQKFDSIKQWNKNDIELLKAVSNQIYMTIKQADLYRKTKELADRENIFRNVVVAIRSTVEINEIKNLIVNETANLFNADRCFILEYDNITETFIPIINEYRSTEQIKSITGEDIEANAPIFINKILSGEDNIIQNTNEYIKNNHLENSVTANYITKYDIKSLFALPIFYLNKLLGVMVIHYTEPEKTFTAEDIEFARIIANQCGIAIYQSQLYEKVKKNAETERLLKEIITNVKLTSSLEEAYKYLSEKLMSIFNIDKILFAEFYPFKSDKLKIVYELDSERNFSKFQNIKIPDLFFNVLNTSIKNIETIEINNINDYFPDEVEGITFLDLQHINATLIQPFTKFTDKAKLLGTAILCTNKERSWTYDEFSLLNLISEAVVPILWEIMKRIELEEMRDTFISTLAHDIGVPLVGEHKALEFCLSRPDGHPLSKYKDIIHEIMRSNESLYKLLYKLVDSYNYEAGKVNLLMGKANIKTIIDDVLFEIKETIELKNIDVELNFSDIPIIEIDAKEMHKAIFTIIENAVTYVKSEGKILIKLTKTDNNIRIYIHDNGSGIDDELKNKIFERYAMSKTTERKIGSGLGLYLTKQIIETHKGKIWFESQNNKGTSFTIELPINL